MCEDLQPNYKNHRNQFTITILYFVDILNVICDRKVQVCIQNRTRYNNRNDHEKSIILIIEYRPRNNL